jgi:hypothetical protein
MSIKLLLLHARRHKRFVMTVTSWCRSKETLSEAEAAPGFLHHQDGQKGIGELYMVMSKAGKGKFTGKVTRSSFPCRATLQKPQDGD